MELSMKTKDKLYIGDLLILEEYIRDTGTRHKRLKCKCKCGKLLDIPKSMVTTGIQTSCGKGNCHNSVRKNLGTKINKLTLLSYDTKTHKYYCQCECGNFTYAQIRHLKAGAHQSCGCLRKTFESRSKRRNCLEDGVAPQRHVLRGYKRNAKNRGLKFDIPDGLFFELIKMPCHYCGVIGYSSAPLTRKFFEEKPFFYNGIDRKDNKIGYEPENCVPCCSFCNYAKLGTPFEEWMDWINRLKNHKIS
jgi:hypothetical protein